MVVDIDSNTLAGDIPDTPGVHGIALAPELNRGFTSNGKADTVTIFSLDTLKTLGQVKTGQDPDAIVYDPASKLVFAFNAESGDATVFDAASGTVTATIALGGRPEFAETDAAGHIYANIEDTKAVQAGCAHGLKNFRHQSRVRGQKPAWESCVKARLAAWHSGFN